MLPPVSKVTIHGSLQVPPMERRSMIRSCTGGTPQADSWCPYCYANGRGRESNKGHAHYQPARIRSVTYRELHMQRPSQAARPKKGEFICPDKVFLKDYPAIAAGCCDEWWDDGKPRSPWTLKFSFGADGVVLTITDKDSKLVCFTSSEGFYDALAAAEHALEGGVMSWRKSKW